MGNRQKHNPASIGEMRMQNEKHVEEARLDITTEPEPERKMKQREANRNEGAHLVYAL